MIFAAGRSVARAVLGLARLAILVFIAHIGADIVQNVTQGMCAATAHAPPAWCLHQ